MLQKFPDFLAENNKKINLKDFAEERKQEQKYII